jgi:CHAT domain-containing protein
VQYWEEARSKLDPEKFPAEYVEVSVQLAEGYLELGRLQRALEILIYHDKNAQFQLDKIKEPLRLAEVKAKFLIQLSDIYFAMDNLNEQCTVCRQPSCKPSSYQAREENLKKARDYLNEAQKVIDSHQAQFLSLRASIFNKQGNIQMAQEEFPNALASYKKAIDLAKQANDGNLEAKIWLSLVQAYADILSTYHEDIRIVKQSVDTGVTSQANIVQAMATFGQNKPPLLVSNGEQNRAETLLEQLVEPHILNQNGETLSGPEGLKQAQVAFEITLRTALQKSVILGNSHSRAFALVGLVIQFARVLSFSSETAQFDFPVLSEDQKINLVYPALKQSLDIAEKIQDIRTVAYVKSYLAELYAQEKRYPEAIQLVRQAIFHSRNYPEGLHVEIQREVWGYPELLYRLQWQLATLLKKRAPFQRERCQDVIDWQEEPYEYECAYERAAKHLQLVQRAYGSVSQKFRGEAEKFYLERADLLLLAAKDARRNRDVNTEQTLLKATIGSIESFNKAELQNFFQDPCITETFFSEDDDNKGKGFPKNAAILHIFLLDNGVELLLSSYQGVQSFSSQKFTSEKVKEKAGQFLERIIRKLPGRDDERKTCAGNERDLRKCQFGKETNYLSLARELYESFFTEEVSTTLTQLGIDTLIIVPTDNKLFTIPFAALYDGEKYLIERYALVVTYSSKAGLQPVISEIAKGDHALLNGLTKLSGVELQLEEIPKLLISEKLTDESFIISKVEEKLKAERTPSSAFVVIHFATHGHFEGSTAQNIYLETSRAEEKLTIDRLETLIRETTLRNKKSVKLLTLGACQSAVGDDRRILGLAGLAVKAGSRSALGTLWLVQKPSSTPLIIEFYKQLVNHSPNLSMAKALREAQLSLIATSRQEEPEKNFIDPYHWAPFVLVGGPEHNTE